MDTVFGQQEEPNHWLATFQSLRWGLQPQGNLKHLQTTQGLEKHH